MLGHADIRTTEESYGHYDLSDLERAMEEFAKSRGKDLRVVGVDAARGAWLAVNCARRDTIRCFEQLVAGQRCRRLFLRCSPSENRVTEEKSVSRADAEQSDESSPHRILAV